MIKKIFKSTYILFLRLLNINSTNNTNKNNNVYKNDIEEKLNEAISVKIEDQKIEEIPVVSREKLLFQPNTIQSGNPMECPINTKNQPIEIPINDSNSLKNNVRITLECNEAAIHHINNLCRFFEVSQTDALARGVWLLTVARDVEVNNKKLGVITTDKNGLVIDIMPINIV